MSYLTLPWTNFKKMIIPPIVMPSQFTISVNWVTAKRNWVDKSQEALAIWVTIWILMTTPMYIQENYQRFLLHTSITNKPSSLSKLILLKILLDHLARRAWLKHWAATIWQHYNKIILNNNNSKKQHLQFLTT